MQMIRISAVQCYCEVQVMYLKQWLYEKITSKCKEIYCLGDFNGFLKLHDGTTFVLLFFCFMGE